MHPPPPPTCSSGRNCVEFLLPAWSLGLVEEDGKRKHAVSSCPNSLARGCGKSKPVYVCKHLDVYSYTVYVNNNINMDQ